MGKPSDGVPDAPVEVLGQVPGFKFSGAFAYSYDMVKSTSGDVVRPGDNSNTGGFIINRNRGVTEPLTLILSLDDGVYPGRYFTGIQFDVYTNSSNPKVTAVLASGAREEKELTPGDGANLWTRNPLITFDALSQVTRLEFSTTLGGGIGLDNLSITLSAGSDGTVPEPGSYALVGVALLAAGAARRRKA